MCCTMYYHHLYSMVLVHSCSMNSRELENFAHIVPAPIGSAQVWALEEETRFEFPSIFPGQLVGWDRANIRIPALEIRAPMASPAACAGCDHAGARPARGSQLVPWGSEALMLDCSGLLGAPG